jgi:hypothetical protein
VIFRWEHEKVLEDMREQGKNNPDSVKKRNCMSEHPSIRRGFNQGYFLNKGLVKVGEKTYFSPTLRNECLLSKHHDILLISIVI